MKEELQKKAEDRKMNREMEKSGQGEVEERGKMKQNRRG